MRSTGATPSCTWSLTVSATRRPAWRAAAGRRSGHPTVEALVARLQAASADVRRLWAEHEVAVRRADRKTMLHERVGDPATDADFLRSRSPLTYVDRIAVPLLIAQGANDPRVKQAESEQIVAAMKAKGIPYEYLLFADEGHGFAKPENRLKFYAAAERFLAQHLGGRYEPGDD